MLEAYETETTTFQWPLCISTEMTRESRDDTHCHELRSNDHGHFAKFRTAFLSVYVLVVSALNWMIVTRES